jgi:hypothetical protein
MLYKNIFLRYGFCIYPLLDLSLLFGAARRSLVSRL